MLSAHEVTAKAAHLCCISKGIPMHIQRHVQKFSRKGKASFDKAVEIPKGLMFARLK